MRVTPKLAGGPSRDVVRTAVMLPDSLSRRLCSCYLDGDVDRRALSLDAFGGSAVSTPR